jgi:hypothetical protein
MSDRVLDDFSMVDVSDLLVPMIIVYDDSTSDYPNRYVARLFDRDFRTNCVVVKVSHEEILKVIPEHMVKLQRNKFDDPVIVEVWV